MSRDLKKVGREVMEIFGERGLRGGESKGLGPDVKTHLMGLSKNKQAVMAGVEYWGEGENRK